MALPQAVQKQVEEAEALQQQLYSESQEPASAEPPVSESVENTEAPPSNVVELQSRAEPPPVETPKAVETPDESAYWKKRFDTVQGVLNAEVPKLNSQLKEQNAQILQLMAQLQEKQSRQPEQEAVTSKDEEDYGPDLIDMVRRVSQDAAARAVAQAVTEFRKDFGAVRAEVGNVQERVFQSESDKFWAGVMSLVPDWQEIDSNPLWIEWLDTTPEFAEDTYRELANKAIQRGDARKIANLVSAWRGPQQPAVQKPDPQAELQRQVAPSSSKSSSTPPQTAKLWTRDEYEAAMDPRNVQRMGQKEADRLESEANQAVAEGRVRW